MSHGSPVPRCADPAITLNEVAADSEPSDKGSPEFVRARPYSGVRTADPARSRSRRRCLIRRSPTQAEVCKHRILTKVDEGVEKLHLISPDVDMETDPTNATLCPVEEVRAVFEDIRSIALELR